MGRIMQRLLPKVEVAPPIDPTVVSSDPNQVRYLN